MRKVWKVVQAVGLVLLLGGLAVKLAAGGASSDLESGSPDAHVVSAIQGWGQAAFTLGLLLFGFVVLAKGVARWWKD